MARPLRRPQDFIRFAGSDVELTTTATEGRRKFKGSIASANDAGVTLALDGEGISLDEVTAQNAWVSDAVEKLDPISGSYTLEVSSPGMARPLRRPSDFERYIGSAVELVTTATEGRRKFKGTIAATDEQAVTLELEDGEQVSIPHGDVKKCALKPVYDFKGGKGDK